MSTPAEQIALTIRTLTTLAPSLLEVATAAEGVLETARRDGIQPGHHELVQVMALVAGAMAKFHEVTSAAIPRFVTAVAELQRMTEAN